VTLSLSKLWPAGFRGQVAGILLLGLVLSQALAAGLYIVLLPEWQRELRPEEAVTKLDVTVRLLESIATIERNASAQRLNDRHFLIKYEPNGLFAEHAPGDTAADAELRQQLALKLGKPLDQVQVHPANGTSAPDLKRIDILLRGGGLLAVVTPVGNEHRLGRVEQAAIAAFFLFVMVGLWAWLTWMVNAPLMRFSHAAERVGLDVHAPPFPEQGPAQLKRAIRAFNQMQVRLQRLLTDRTLMLGTISHDLRTPLTRLRLRVETDRVDDESPKMLADIEAMESMLTSTLSFVRGVEDAEASETVDLDLALQTVCDMVSDVGGDVVYQGPARCRYLCKPQAMMRALTNVVSNAAKYGEHARVSLRHETDLGYVIEVDDDGPGIPDDEKIKVFEPFYRTAAARDRDSQGMGLGLSIARSIVLSHGGSIELYDVIPHGLRVCIVLPEAPPS
jgi:two-component system OmpR family sensor kinase